MKRLIKLMIISALLLSLFYSMMTPALALIVKDEGIGETYADTGAGAPSEQDFAARLNELRLKYPDGTAWEGVYYESGMAKAWTCHAYAVQLFCEIFDVQFYLGGYFNRRDYDYGTICAGDIVRIDYDSHSIFITRVTEDYIYFTDGNSIGYNVVRWDGRYSISEFKSRFCYKYHFSGNNLTGNVPLTHTITYFANGGEGSAASTEQVLGQKLTLPKNAFTRTGYTFAGYSVNRRSDAKWYTNGHGWQLMSDIIDNGYEIRTYSAGTPFTFSSAWISGLTEATAFVFYAQWLPNETVIEYYRNESDVNYLCDPIAGGILSNSVYCSGDRYSVAVDSTNQLNENHSLQIKASAAGGAGNEISIETSTNYGYSDGYTHAGVIGDDREFTLGFMAKSSVNGAKMYIRYSGNSVAAARSVTLTDSWTRYSVLLPKNSNVGNRLLIYFDEKGTYTLNSMVLADGSQADSLDADTGEIMEVSRVTCGETPLRMPVPTRDGYKFIGWYTARVGGARITAQTPVTAMHMRLYAHWRRLVSDEPVKTVVNGRHTYELYDRGLTREDAETFCRARGGTLVSVTNETERSIVEQMLEGYRQFCWLGLSYDDAAEQWRWDSGEEVRRTLWSSGEGGAVDGQYDAVVVTFALDGLYEPYRWIDCCVSDCEALYLNYRNSVFICEYIEESPPTEVVGHGLCGDADCDGDINIIDATCIQKHLAGLITLNEDSLTLADADLSEDINIIDVTMIQRHLIGLTDRFSCIGELLELTRAVMNQSTPDEPMPVL